VKVDAATLQVVDTWVFDFGIRPNVFTADEKILYTQLSYLNGVIKYDLALKQEIARSDQPLSAFALETYATYDEYPHDSAHHGLAISGDGQLLCDCGTIDNTVQILSTGTMEVLTTTDVGMVPYWATTSPEGDRCFVSISGDDTISVISYETGAELRTLPVGAFPQRSRLAKMPESVVANLNLPQSADAGAAACTPDDVGKLFSTDDAGASILFNCMLGPCLLDLIGSVGACLSTCAQTNASVSAPCGDCVGAEVEAARDRCLAECADDLECYADCALGALGAGAEHCVL
jgi:WD40 repeat protein